MTENSPPPAARTPGQATRTAYFSTIETLAGHVDDDWDILPDNIAKAWEAAAQAAIAAAPAGPENGWAEAFHDDAAEARAEVLRLRERVGELEAANAALVLAQPDASQAAEITALRNQLERAEADAKLLRSNADALAARNRELRAEAKPW